MNISALPALVRLAVAEDGLKSTVLLKSPTTYRFPALSISISRATSDPGPPRPKAHWYWPLLLYLATKTSCTPLLVKLLVTVGEGLKSATPPSIKYPATYTFE